MKKALVLLFAAALFSMTVPAAIIMIDDFDNDSMSAISLQNNALVTANGEGIAGVLGGRREIGALCLAGCLPENPPQDVDPDDAGFFTTKVFQNNGNVSLESNVSGVGYFLYEGNGKLGLGGGLGQDFSLVDFFVISVKSMDLNNGFSAKVTLTDASAGVASSEQAIPAGSDFLLNFGAGEFGAVNLSEIISVRLDLTSNVDAADLTMDQFYANTVPEPGTYAMLGAGLCGLALLRRRAVK